MNINGLDLIGFSKEKPFSFSNLKDYKFGGVYMIIKKLPKGKEEIVKIGESNFILRRIGNYLDKDYKSSSKTVTKDRIQAALKLKSKATYHVIWKEEEDPIRRKKLEKEMLMNFKAINGNYPDLNKSSK